jgi:hypothetical protein
MYPSSMTRSALTPQEREEGELSSGNMRKLKLENYVNGATAPTDGLSTALLDRELAKAFLSAALFVHVRTDELENPRSRELRLAIWHLSVTGIPKEFMQHLYLGDITGLLLALVPLHEGRAEDIQRKSVRAFHDVKKAGLSFLQFRGAFKECIELMSFSGIELPNIYVRLQFVDGMATDKRYDRAMVDLLSTRPKLTLEILIIKLLGYAESYNDCYLVNQSGASHNTETQDSHDSLDKRKEKEGYRQS